MLHSIQRTLGWMGSLYLDSFRKKLARPREIQLGLLKNLTRDLAQSRYGESLGIQGGESVEEFQAKVPIITYSDLEPWIARQKSTHDPILFAEPVTLYEKTSGSSGPAKLIPYTRTLKFAFGKMACLWIGDILSNGPTLQSGRTFISVSPAFATEIRTELGIPIGMEDDSDYLPAPAQALLSRFLVTPAGIKKLPDPTDYRWVLSCALLAAEDLEVISIWNPSYLTALFSFILQNRVALCEDLRAGRTERAEKTFRFEPLSEARIQLLLTEGSDAVWQRLWPSLQWISCWTDAGARVFAEELAGIFPQAKMQGKGLLATEAPMTIPLIEAPAPVPLIEDVFFEFLDSKGKVHLLDGLQPDTEYELIISPRGGFVRYRLGDRVRTSGSLSNTPCLRFIGRGQAVSDLVGEKLHEIFVRETLAGSGLFSDGFHFLVPVASTRPPHYALVMSGRNQASEEANHQKAAALDKLLCQAYHYRYARQLGQLEQAQIWPVPDAQALYFNYYSGRGMKWGDIKSSSLICSPDDAEKLVALCREKTP